MKFEIKNWLAAVSLLFAIAGGSLAGTPLASGHANGKMMACCKKAKSVEQSPAASASRLCCALNCTNSAPPSPGSTVSFSPSEIAVNDSIIRQISAVFSKKNNTSMPPVAFEQVHVSSISQPRYVRYHSFLI